MPLWLDSGYAGGQGDVYDMCALLRFLPASKKIGGLAKRQTKTGTYRCQTSSLGGTYIHAQRVIPGDKERIESLQEKARNDADIQKILQPELERQHNAGVARRSVYNRGGAILLISSAIFIAWFSLFRPKRGTGAGVPAGILKFLEKPPPQRPKIPKKPKTDSKVAIIQ